MSDNDIKNVTEIPKVPKNANEMVASKICQKKIDYLVF